MQLIKIQKNLPQKKISNHHSMGLFITNNVHSNIVHSMALKTNIIFTEVLTTCKGYVQT